MPDLWIIILAISLILVVCPILGKIFYLMENKLAIWVYTLVSIIITILLYIVTDHTPWNDLKGTISNYFQNFLRFNPLYYLTLLAYILGGIGLVGGILEYVGEKREVEDTYKKLKLLAPIKLYFLYMFYGYIFFFAVFAFSQFLMIGFQWEYKGPASFIRETTFLIQFHSIWLPIIGCLLFAIKTFKYGFFSIEFYISEFHPRVADIGWFRREIRHYVACIFGPLSIYFSIFSYFIEQYPPLQYETIAYGKSFFFLAATIQAILFYLLKHRFVDQLKPISERYSLKVGSGPLESFDEKLDKTKFKDADQELRFDD